MHMLFGNRKNKLPATTNNIAKCNAELPVPVAVFKAVSCRRNRKQEQLQQLQDAPLSFSFLLSAQKVVTMKHHRLWFWYVWHSLWHWHYIAIACNY